jgi:hypothetical protein
MLVEELPVVVAITSTHFRRDDVIYFQPILRGEVQPTSCTSPRLPFQQFGNPNWDFGVMFFPVYPVDPVVIIRTFATFDLDVPFDRCLEMLVEGIPLCGCKSPFALFRNEN